MRTNQSCAGVSSWMRESWQLWNRLEESGNASLYKALKHKYKYALSTNLPGVSRHSQFLALLCIFPGLISLQESCGSRFRRSSRLFECRKCSLLLIVCHILEIRNDHPSLVSHGGHTPGTLDFVLCFPFISLNRFQKKQSHA